MAGRQKPLHGRAEPYVGLGSEKLYKILFLLCGDQLLSEITTPCMPWMLQPHGVGRSFYVSLAMYCFLHIGQGHDISHQGSIGGVEIHNI